MKRRFFFAILLGLGVLTAACRQETPAPVTSQPSATAVVVIETLVVPATVVVVATPTPAATLPPPTATAAATSAATVTTTAAATTAATSVPAATAMPTAVSPTTTAAPGPVLLYFRTNVTIADPGQTIRLEWESERATKATLGHLFDGRMTIDLSDLPPSGAYDYPIRPGQRNAISFFLSVEDSEGRWDSDGFTLPLTCPDAWFFSPAPDSCPLAPARLSAGAEQRFENGIMLWEAAERRIYILFNSGSPRWSVVADSWQEGEATCQIEPVPPGRIHPSRGFGKAWCNEIGLRERLGWATEAEMGGYQTAVQSTAYDRYNSLYIRAADGGVYRLAPERSSWEKLTP